MDSVRVVALSTMRGEDVRYGVQCTGSRGRLHVLCHYPDRMRKPCEAHTRNDHIPATRAPRR